MKRKYREIKKWRAKHVAKTDLLECYHCQTQIITGTRYERRVYVETSETGNTTAILVMREHLSPGCKEYEK
jgi:hypothetical protein